MSVTQTTRRQAEDGTWSAPPPVDPPDRDHGPSTAVVGGVLVATGLIWLVAELGLLALGWQSLLAGGLVVVGAAVLTLGLTGHGTGPLSAVGIIAILVLAVTVSTPDLVLGGGVGETVVRPTGIAELDSPYELGMGSMQLDLREVVPAASGTPVEASVGVGELVVWVPQDVAVTITADVGIGEATLLGETRSGTGVVHELIAGPEGARTLQLDLSVAIGSIEVRR